MNQSATTPPEKRPIDWEAVEIQYRRGIRSLKSIGDEFGVSHVGIIKRARRDCWERAAPSKPLEVEPVPIGDVPQAKEDARGFLYVIYMDDSAGKRYFKIGFASTFTARFGAHQCASPFPLHVACAYFVGDMRSEERYLHRLFGEKRIRGEWFDLSADDLAMISERSLLVNGSLMGEIA